MAKNKRVYAVFQGGGAKGILHVGALAALQSAPIDLVGFAGTSAGAIVAALASARYSADEMFNCDSKETILRLINRRPAKSGKAFKAATHPRHLFGLGSWISILLARCFARFWMYVIPAYALVLAVALWLSGPISSAVVAFLLVVLASVGILLVRGFASLDRFVDGMQQLLASALQVDRTTPVTFAMMRDAGCPTLRIVASNMRTRSVAVFSADETPDVPVAEAVAASACVPLIFAPRRIESNTFYDGGLVSNLPAWVFDEERGLDCDAATVTIEIAAQRKIPKRGPRGLTALLSAIPTGIFGAGSLDKRAVGNLFSIALQTPVGLLDFDMSQEVAAREVQSARDECELRLVYRLVELPNVMAEFCDGIALASRTMINAVRRVQGLGNLREAPRVAVALPPANTSRTLKLSFGSGFAGSTDEGLLLPIESSFVGRAWTQAQSFYADTSDPIWGQVLHRPQDQGLRRLVSKKMCWSITVFYEGLTENERLVVAIDGKKPLGLTATARDRLLVTLANAVRSAVDQIVPKELFRHGI